jgi:hypothetical protein
LRSVLRNSYGFMEEQWPKKPLRGTRFSYTKHMYGI